MNGEFPVEQATTKNIFAGIACESPPNIGSPSPSYVVSLDPISRVRRIRAAPPPFLKFYENAVHHQFERIIAGHSYLIEVARVGEKRWRAHILRLPGVPMAMMPFYGETPDEAATHLTDWLGVAHRTQPSPANTV